VAEYVGYIHIDPSILDKIHTKHQLTEGDVRDAFQWPAEARGFWEDHPEHGLRYLVKGKNYAGRVILGWLEPVDIADGTWVLRSARAGT
jgi:hypothetical protein